MEQKLMRQAHLAVRGAYAPLDIVRTYPKCSGCGVDLAANGEVGHLGVLVAVAEPHGPLYPQATIALKCLGGRHTVVGLRFVRPFLGDAGEALTKILKNTRKLLRSLHE